MKNYESKYFNTATKMDLALISLLKKKPFDYITVSEICEEAGEENNYIFGATVEEVVKIKKIC